MKQMDVIEKTIGEHRFFIRPFPAFVAANISGELVALIGPMLSGISGLIGKPDTNAVTTENSDNPNIMDMDIDEALPSFANAFSSLSGDKIERLMKKLLINSDNISVEGPCTQNLVKRMDMDLANEVFCSEVQDMFVLCFEVIKVNYGGFFKKLVAQYGNLQDVMQKVAPSTTNGESSI